MLRERESAREKKHFFFFSGYRRVKWGEKEMNHSGDVDAMEGGGGGWEMISPAHFERKEN